MSICGVIRSEPDAAAVPASAATIPAIPNAHAKTSLVEMPWAMAASWSKWVARMAIPIRV